MSGSTPVDEFNVTSGSPRQSGTITCGSCNAANPSGGQFCAGCGHALYEPCADCTKPVLLTQSFCGNCGCDLVAAISKRKAELEGKITDAINAAKERDFERSKGFLGIVTREKDYRFKDVIANAKVAQQKIDSIAAQETESASDRIEAAQEAFDLGDSIRVVELLGHLSPKLLTPKAKENLEQSKTRLQQLEQADQSLQEAFRKRDWVTSGAILDRLMELQPDDDSVAKLAMKVGKKLISKATDLRENHKYRAAHEVLECVPSNSRGSDYEQLTETVERILWLAAQFAGEPFATPTLGRLAKQWVEQSGNDPRATKMLGRISKRIKSPRSSTRQLFPPLEVKSRSWAGGPLGLLAFPTCIDVEDNAALRNSAGQYNVAIGLALQGLGQARVTEDFTPKKGLLKRLGRKKSSICWGIDIGASGLKAVCLEKAEDERPSLLECYQQPFNAPMTRNLADSKMDESIREAIEKFASEYDLETTPVWVSFPARELVSRFVKLPPVADKQAKILFDKEVETRIPLPLDEVTTVSWVAPLPEDELTGIGRPAFVAAAKKQFVEQYLENLSLAGLTVSGLQATPIALTNFVAAEFAEEVGEEVEIDDDSSPTLPTVGIFDCGAEMTTVLFVNAKSSWFWSFESGGNEFTRLIGRATKKTHSEAEKLKRNPASLDHPQHQLEMVEKRMEEMQGRLFKLVSDVKVEHEEYDIRETWCCGGGSLTHGWIKRVLCEN